MVIQSLKTQDGYQFTIAHDPEGVLLDRDVLSVSVTHEMATKLWDSAQRENPNIVREFVASQFGLQDEISCRFVDEHHREIKRAPKL